ncbi:hypothetical protein BJX99DRAFT_260023 [Aspergillus californicus]
MSLGQDQHPSPAWMDFSGVESCAEHFSFQPDFDLETLLMDPVNPALLPSIENGAPSAHPPGISHSEGDFGGTRAPTQSSPVLSQQSSLLSLPELSWRKSFHVPEAKRGEMAAIMRQASQQSCAGEDMEIPPALAMQRYVAAFFDVFPSILPCFHRPTWKADEQQPALLLALTAVGAAICDKVNTSLALHRAAQLCIWNYMQMCRFRLDGQPIWVIQTMLLVMFFGTWSGKSSLLNEALSFQSILANCVRSLKHPEDSWVTCETSSAPTWAQWLEIETIIRTKLSVYLYFSQLNIAFNMPFLLINSEVDIALPCTEDEWQAASEAEWSRVRAQTNTARVCFIDSLEGLLSSHDNCLPAWSPLGSLVMVHAILQEIWQLRHYNNGNLLSEQLRPLEHGLRRLESIWEVSSQSLTAGSLPQSLSLDASALFKSAYFRIYADFPRPKPGVLSFDQGLMRQLVNLFVKHVPRSPETSRAAYHAIRALLMPFTADLEWTQRNMTGVVSLHIYFLPSMQCCLYLSRWLEALASANEADWTPDEQKVMEMTKATLDEIGVDADFVQAPIHVQIVHGWCSMFKNSGQWGFAPHFVQVMRRYAESLLG